LFGKKKSFASIHASFGNVQLFIFYICY